VEGWFQSRLRIGVMSGYKTESGEFKEWKTRCIGHVVVQPELIDDKYLIPTWYAYFENECDLFNYLLTFDEAPARQPDVDIGMFYAPYVPPTVTSVINYGNVTPVTFNTRYGEVNVVSDGTSDGDGGM
jgi:hypothetical protein